MNYNRITICIQLQSQYVDSSLFAHQPSSLYANRYSVTSLQQQPINNGRYYQQQPAKGRYVQQQQPSAYIIRSPPKIINYWSPPPPVQPKLQSISYPIAPPLPAQEQYYIPPPITYPVVKESNYYVAKPAYPLPSCYKNRSGTL